MTKIKIKNITPYFHKYDNKTNLYHYHAVCNYNGVQNAFELITSSELPSNITNIEEITGHPLINKNESSSYLSIFVQPDMIIIKNNITLSDIITKTKYKIFNKDNNSIEMEEIADIIY